MIYLETSNVSYISQNEPSHQLRARYTSREPGYYVVLAEFSELYGPMPIKTIPDGLDENTSEDINDFIVQIMSIDYTGTHAGVPSYSPADTSLIYQHTKSKVSAFIHFFNLHDVHARGYSRIFTLSFITRSSRVLFKNIDSIKSCFESISRTCHVENRIQFHAEMIDKRNEFKNNPAETKQLNWWLEEMRKRYSLQEHLVKAPLSVSQEDIEPSRNQIANPGAVQLRRTRSLIQDLNSVRKYASQNIKTPGEHKLREIRDLVTFSYEFLERSLKQLHKSKGSDGSIRRAEPSKTPSLSLGYFVLQLPSPLLKYEDTNSHESYFDEHSFDILSGLMDCNLDENDPQFIKEFSEKVHPHDHSTRVPNVSNVSNGVPNVSNGARSHDPLNLTSADQISCINPSTIELDLTRFKRVLKTSYKDCVFSVLSGRPMVIVGDLDQDITASFKNALSLFVTAPNRIYSGIKNTLTLEDLSRYTLLQCKRTAASDVEWFAKMGLCSVIYHDKRCGKAPSYTGQIISRIWGTNMNTRSGAFQVNESVLFSIVQSGLVSDLGAAIIEKYYSMLLHENCSIESVLGNTMDEQCDDLILQFQTLLLLNPAHKLLMTSHNLSTEFKYEYRDNRNTTFPARFTS